MLQELPCSICVGRGSGSVSGEREERSALIVYRLEQADESLGAAHLLLREKTLRSCINRAYYAMFYCVLALLASQDLKSRKHTGAIDLFDRQFVKTSEFEKSFSRWLHEAFDLRGRSDYLEMFEISDNRARGIVEQAEKFVAATRDYLAAKGWIKSR